jgi:cyclophilin family peptidyl-prolyl cis-trans isomerase
MVIDPNKKYRAIIELQKGGQIVIELFAKDAPKTVNNFVFLARDGYYDGVTFHRVIPGFMAQTGDPTGTGAGGPGYQFDNELSPNLRHDGPGVVSMANAGIRGGRGTNGSQFFITYVATPHLDGYNPDGTAKNCAAPGVSCHAVFGKVVQGQDVVEKISVRDPGSARTPGDVIKTIRIEESQ